MKILSFLKPALFLCLAFSCSTSYGQIRLEGDNQREIDPRLFSGRWPAWWIAVPGEPENDFGVWYFRKTFTLGEVPESFTIHVSADNRYKLYVNGVFASLGPAAGDVYNWNFETVDIAPMLRGGENIIAAVVWNFAGDRPLAQMSLGKTGFLLQGNSSREEAVDTGDSWVCTAGKAYSPYKKSVLGYYAAGAGEQMDAEKHIWGWELPEYDDSEWVSAKRIIQGAMKGARDYPGWQLVPRPIRQMEMEPVQTGVVRTVRGADIPDGFPAGKKPFTIPANTQAEFILDNGNLMTGYPTLGFSRGRGSEIEMEYAESLYDEPRIGEKGNRNEVEGKLFIGYADKVISDGGAGRKYTPLWWRTWRYLRVTVKTAQEPLVIDELTATTSMYPLKRETTFHAAGRPYMNDILETGWRTARLCANETYMDCPYYEQLQYFGDTRIQAMITLFNTRNDELVRNAIEHGRQSIVPEGITMSRYPSSLHQFIPSFSLWWICMCHDYWMYRGDEHYLTTLLPSFRGVLAWFEEQLKDDLSLARIPYWFFLDWCGTPNGEPVREAEGNSSIQDLQFILTLDAAAAMEEAFGSAGFAAHYRELAGRIKATLHDKYWNGERGLFADTHDHRSFSQHANVLAIIAGACEGADATALFDRLIADKEIHQCTIYFRYYLQIAMKMAGRGGMLSDDLGVWRDQLSLGLTTWAEKPEPSRSDCHAWGASPNIEFFRMILGIESAAPGFTEVRIAPTPGKLKEVSGSMPHPAGAVSVSYRVSKKGGLTADVGLPEGISGTFVWNGKERRLNPGIQTIRID